MISAQMISARALGAPNWVDLATTNVGEAVRFYGNLLGWDVEETQTPMGEYHIGRLGQRQVGGIMAIPEHESMVPMWTTFVYVDDVDSVVERVMRAEGSLLDDPLDLPDGRVAIVADPVDAMFGVISGPAPEGTWLARDPGSVCWVELLTRDTAAAEAFYSQVFDWTAETAVYGPTPYTTFSLEGEAFAGMMPMPDQVPEGAPSQWVIYFAVDDCDAASAKAIELGGSIVRPSQGIAIGHFAVVEDPQGAVFQLMDYQT